MNGKYQSELLGAVHETAVGLHKIGVIDDNEMREYDRDCLAQESRKAHTAKATAKMEYYSHVTA
ncbi:MAG: hypothetical protein FWC64_06605 [Treponema sp.]|nr:hypothetical protein [Treponema sp.]